MIASPACRPPPTRVSCPPSQGHRVSSTRRRRRRGQRERYREIEHGRHRRPDRRRRRARPEPGHPRRHHPRAPRGLPGDRHPPRLGGAESTSSREPGADNSEHVQVLTEEIVNRAGRTGGTFLHTSRTNPARVSQEQRAGPPAGRLPDAGQRPHPGRPEEPRVSGHRLPRCPSAATTRSATPSGWHQEGVKVIAIPKTMDNDVPGTDYCIGFSTCVTRTIEMTNSLRTTAGSPRALPGDGGVRALRRLHGPAAHHGRRRQPLRDPRAPLRHRAA